MYDSHYQPTDPNLNQCCAASYYALVERRPCYHGYRVGGAIASFVFEPLRAIESNGVFSKRWPEQDITISRKIHRWMFPELKMEASSGGIRRAR